VTVRQIGQVSDPESSDPIGPMFQRNWNDGNSRNTEPGRLNVELMKIDPGDSPTLDFPWLEDVGKALLQRMNCPIMSKRGNGPFLNEIVTADFVQSSNVVSMRMGQKDTLDRRHLVSQHLLPEIR